MALAHFLSKLYPTAWQLGLGLLLVGDRAVRARRHPRHRRDLTQRFARPSADSRHDARCSKPARVSKNFGALRATRDVTFKLEEGARHALIGPNGAGKTTFINLLTGVLLPSAGTVLFKGQDITTIEQAERVKLGIARTFQINRLFRGLSVLENVYISVAERVGAAPDMFTPAGKRRDVIDEAMHLLERLKLADDAHHTIPDCPTAASGWSSSPSRSGSSPRCCCSTSPPPACRARRATSSSTPSTRCRRPSAC